MAVNIVYIYLRQEHVFRPREPQMVIFDLKMNESGTERERASANVVFWKRICSHPAGVYFGKIVRPLPLTALRIVLSIHSVKLF